MVLCEVIPQTEYPKCTHITVAGSRICYPGNIVTPTGSLDLIKLMKNSYLSHRNTRFVFYLQTPIHWPEYVRIKKSDIPQEFIEEYNIPQLVQNGLISFEILWGCYDWMHSGRLVNDLLCMQPNNSGYYEADTTPGLWRHKWHPIQFFLIVDYFSTKYVRKQHALHLFNILEQHYEKAAD